jgi:hypothetical protein
LAVPGAVLLIAGVATLAGLVGGSEPLVTAPAVPAPMATAPLVVPAVVSVDQEYLRYAEQAQATGDWATVDRFLAQVDDPEARAAGYIAAADAAAQIEAWDWVETFLDKADS